MRSLQLLAGLAHHRPISPKPYDDKQLQVTTQTRSPEQILSRLPRHEEARPGICSPAERRSPRAVARRCVSSERGGAPALTYRIDRPRSGAAGIGPSGRHSSVTLVTLQHFDRKKKCGSLSLISRGRTRAMPFEFLIFRRSLISHLREQQAAPRPAGLPRGASRAAGAASSYVYFWRRWRRLSRLLYYPFCSREERCERGHSSTFSRRERRGERCHLYFSSS